MRVTVKYADNISAYYTKEPTEHKTVCIFDVENYTDLTDDEWLERFFAWMNHGSGQEQKDLIMDRRSLSVGDIIEFDGKRFQCAPLGWEKL